VPTKLFHAALVCIGVAWMTAVEGAFGGLLMSAIGIVGFMTASTMDAFRTLWRLDGR